MPLYWRWTRFTGLEEPVFGIKRRSSAVILAEAADFRSTSAGIPRKTCSKDAKYGARSALFLRWVPHVLAARAARPAGGRTGTRGGLMISRLKLVVFMGAWGALMCANAGQVPAPMLPDGFVHLRTVDPTILQDIRYATERNFTAAPVPGYRAAECILKREVADALKRTQASLRPKGLALKVYDCYRPMRAVRSFVEWGRSSSSPGDERYYPGIARQTLVPLGYIAEDSSHAKGIAVDVTLVRLDAPGAAAANAQGGGSCVAPRSERESDNSVDMGTGYDCFDALSHTDNPAITSEQASMRRMLVEALTAQGFKNFDQEWWHFTYDKLGMPPSMDFEVTPAP